MDGYTNHGLIITKTTSTKEIGFLLDCCYTLTKPILMYGDGFVSNLSLPTLHYWTGFPAVNSKLRSFLDTLMIWSFPPQPANQVRILPKTEAAVVATTMPNWKSF